MEVIDISRNEWCLVRLVGRPEEEEEEGWVPAGFLKPYSGGGFGKSTYMYVYHVYLDLFPAY